MGSVYMRYSSQRWYVRFRTGTGWTQQRTDLYGPDHERAARRVLAKIESRIAAGVETGQSGPMTVGDWAERWSKKRHTLGLSDDVNDAARLRIHVLPVIGDVRLDQVRPRHVVAVIDRARAASKAPKTVRNIYSVMRAMFRDAQMEDLLETNPCILTRHQLGDLHDRDQGWRATAKFDEHELVSFISDERIPMDRRVWYAVQGIGGLRHGEAAGLRFADYDSTVQPLGRIIVARSYDKKTKTRRTRYVPVHPTLAAMLAEWRMYGWAHAMGRQPEPGDLVFPTTVERGTRMPLGSMRTKSYSRRRWEHDLEALGLRHRRGHDLRRTMISLARTDGARRDLLQLCTHTPHRDAAIDDYTTFEWPSLCGEIAKLRVSRTSSLSDQACFVFASSGSEALDLQPLLSGGAGNRTQDIGSLECHSSEVDVEFERKQPPNVVRLAAVASLDVGLCDSERSKRSTVALDSDTATRIARYLDRLAEEGDVEASVLVGLLRDGGVR